MLTRLTTPIQVPPKTLHVQRIEGVYIDYADRSISVTVADYEDENAEFPENTKTEAINLDVLTTSEYLTHYKFVFKSIREKIRELGLLGNGVDTNEVIDRE